MVWCLCLYSVQKVRVKAAEEEAPEIKGGEVVDLDQRRPPRQTARDRASARTRGGDQSQRFLKGAAEGQSAKRVPLKESKTIERWKTLAGIK